MDIITWNVWGIPFVAPKMLSRPLDCGSRIGGTIKECKGFSIICIQEAWGWGAGICWPLLKLAQQAEYLPSFLSYISYFIYSVGALGVLIPVPPRWDPKTSIAERIAQMSGRTLEQDLFVVGNRGESQEYCHAVLDSGLMLVLGMRPTLTGFSRYIEKSGEDAFANKGYLWAFVQERNTLIVNTHLQASGRDSVRLSQLQQLRQFLDEFSSAQQGVTIFVAGDFNMPAGGAQPPAEVLGLRCLTAADSLNCLDHVLGNVSPSAATTETEDISAHGHLSDHPRVRLKLYDPGENN